MKKRNLRILSLWLALCMAFSLLSGWGPVAAAAESGGDSAELLAGGVEFENNACPWGTAMTYTGFTLNIRVKNADGASYQWQSSPDKENGWTNVSGATAEQYTVTAPASGTMVSLRGVERRRERDEQTRGGDSVQRDRRRARARLEQ